MDNNDMTPEMNDPDNLDGDETDGTTADQRDSADEIPTSDQAAAFDETAEYTEDPPAYENLTTGPTSYQSGLVRDPYATFGGVISGIAHRYGWDVALTRLGFLATVILTGGSALLLYVFAWLIVPRATYWPPNERVKRSGLTSRELGFGLAAAGILIYLAVGTGGFGQAVVPLALVGGGVWMLLQNPRPESAELAATPTMAMAGANAPPVDVYQPIGSASPPRQLVNRQRVDP